MNLVNGRVYLITVSRILHYKPVDRSTPEDMENVEQKTLLVQHAQDALNEIEGSVQTFMTKPALRNAKRKLESAVEELEKALKNVRKESVPEYEYTIAVTPAERETDEVLYFAIDQIATKIISDEWDGDNVTALFKAHENLDGTNMSTTLDGSDMTDRDAFIQAVNRIFGTLYVERSADPYTAEREAIRAARAQFS